MLVYVFLSKSLYTFLYFSAIPWHCVCCALKQRFVRKLFVARNLCGVFADATVQLTDNLRIKENTLQNSAILPIRAVELLQLPSTRSVSHHMPTYWRYLVRFLPRRIYERYFTEAFVEKKNPITKLC